MLDANMGNLHSRHSPLFCWVLIVIAFLATSAARSESTKKYSGTFAIGSKSETLSQIADGVCFIIGMKLPREPRMRLHIQSEILTGLGVHNLKLSVKRTFRIGDNTVFVVKVARSHIEIFERAISKMKIVSLFEVDKRREAAKLNDPYYTTSGLWGQSFDNQWAIKRVGFTDGSSSAWAKAGTSLKPVVVAVIDSGLDWYHPDISRDALWRNPKETPYNNADDDGNGYVDDIIGWNLCRRHNRGIAKQWRRHSGN
jgi:subtilisin family serine protease